MRRVIPRLAVGCCAISLLAAGCAGEPARTLVVHTTWPEAVREAVAERFEAAHPDVGLELVEASAAETLQALSTGASAPDAWWGASVVDLAAAAAEGLLAPLPGVETGGDTGSDGQRFWHATHRSPFVIAINRTFVSLADAPTDWIDLFHHRYYQEVVALDPVRSRAGAEFLGGMIVQALRDDDLLRGFDWSARLDAQIESYAGDEAEALRRLEAGTEWLAVLPLHAVAAAGEDADWLHHRVAAGGTPALVRGVAVSARTADPALALAFAEAVASDDVVALTAGATHWSPVGSPAPWTAYPPAADTLAAELRGWIDRWDLEVRGPGR